MKKKDKIRTRKPTAPPTRVYKTRKKELERKKKHKKEESDD